MRTFQSSDDSSYFALASIAKDTSINEVPTSLLNLLHWDLQKSHAVIIADFIAEFYAKTLRVISRNVV